MLTQLSEINAKAIRKVSEFDEKNAIWVIAVMLVVAFAVFLIIKVSPTRQEKLKVLAIFSIMIGIGYGLIVNFVYVPGDIILAENPLMIYYPIPLYLTILPTIILILVGIASIVFYFKTDRKLNESIPL